VRLSDRAARAMSKGDARVEQGWRPNVGDEQGWCSGGVGAGSAARATSRGRMDEETEKRASARESDGRKRECAGSIDFLEVVVS
jgi:hypothetical protein